MKKNEQKDHPEVTHIKNICDVTKEASEDICKKVNDHKNAKKISPQKAKPKR
ncbi:hypothetical protein [Legionella sp. WA2024007413]